MKIDDLDKVLTLNEQREELKAFRAAIAGRGDPRLMVSIRENQIPYSATLPQADILAIVDKTITAVSNKLKDLGVEF